MQLETTTSIRTRPDLTRNVLAQFLLVNRWPQLVLRVITLAGFLFTILAGLLGSPVGSHNFAIIFVWIAWWTSLKLFFIPFGGRSWCSICPIPLPGEWIQQGGVLGPYKPGLSKQLRWPKKLRGSWLQAGGFLLIGLFSALTLTSSRVTGIVLLAILLLAFLLSLVFERRAFCNYLCPIGGFTGLYAQAGPVEVRVKDPAVCAGHAQKTCYQACPWGQYPLALKSSANCGLCMECLRACPEDNLAVNLRAWGSELGPATKHSLDDAFLGLVMLATALANAALFLGPWGQLKMAAYAIGRAPWFTFAGFFLAGSLGVLPGLYLAAVWAGRRLGNYQTTLRQALVQQSQALVPLGLMAWIAFTISFAFSKLTYILPVISDPMGWGWNLIGGVSSAWVGQSTSLSLLVQVAILAVGLYWACRVSRGIAGSVRQALPMGVFSAVFSLALLWLLVG